MGENGFFKSYYNRHVCYVDIIGLLLAFFRHNNLMLYMVLDNLCTQFVVLLALESIFLSPMEPKNLWHVMKSYFFLWIVFFYSHIDFFNKHGNVYFEDARGLIGTCINNSFLFFWKYMWMKMYVEICVMLFKKWKHVFKHGL